MGGHLYACGGCSKSTFAYHSCNHRSCPQCGRSATTQWVARELDKRVNAPYFMVTFTLPSELRSLFSGRGARDAYSAFFTASASALAEKLASPRYLGAAKSGFTGILHTWNQQLHFHPHIHYIVPGCGLTPNGQFVKVKSDQFLLPVKLLSRAFRSHFGGQLLKLGTQVDPDVWKKDWGVNIQPFGTGENAIKYLGTYVCRTAIGDSRIVSVNDNAVTFRWKDRAKGNAQRTSTIPGAEFVTRYLRHVLPREEDTRARPLPRGRTTHYRSSNDTYPRRDRSSALPPLPTPDAQDTFPAPHLVARPTRQGYMNYRRIHLTTSPFFHCPKNGNGDLRTNGAKIRRSGVKNQGKPYHPALHPPPARMKSVSKQQVTAHRRRATGTEQTQNA